MLGWGVHCLCRTDSARAVVPSRQEPGGFLLLWQPWLVSAVLAGPSAVLGTCLCCRSPALPGDLSSLHPIAAHQHRVPCPTPQLSVPRSWLAPAPACQCHPHACCATSLCPLPEGDLR